MKMRITKEWLLKNADRDKDLEVAAGYLSAEKMNATYGAQKQESEEQIEEAERRLTALAIMVNTSRRKHGWTLEQLAAKADVDLEDVVSIEKGIPTHLSIRTIHKISKVLNLPHGGLLRLSGATTQPSNDLSQQALRFVARSQPDTKPTKQEIKALEEFVKFLAEE